MKKSDQDQFKTSCMQNISIRIKEKNTEVKNKKSHCEISKKKLNFKIKEEIKQGRMTHKNLL